MVSSTENVVSQSAQTQGFALPNTWSGGGGGLVSSPNIQWQGTTSGANYASASGILSAPTAR